jgi:hypothetical protein
MASRIKALALKTKLLWIFMATKLKAVVPNITADESGFAPVNEY